MDQLSEIVRAEVLHYAMPGYNLQMFPFINEDLYAYAVLIVDTPIRKQPAGIVVFARIVDDYIVIEDDKTDRPLYEALERAGIPREKIICVYAGEALPAEIAQSQAKVQLPAG